MIFSSSFRRQVARSVCAAACALAAVALGEAWAQNSMQGVPNAMQGFSQNRDKPIQIEAAALEVRDKKKEATFSGNVKVVQGDTTMTSKSLVVFYDDDAKGQSKPQNMKAADPGPGGEKSIKRIEAKGGVTVVQKDQIATGETAIFNMRENTVMLNGNVVVTRGQDVLKGQRLTVDLTNGVSKLDGAGGRVDVIINTPKPSEKAGEKK